MKRIVITALLVSAGWWYFNRPEPLEPSDRTARIVVGSPTGDRIVWERD